MSEFFGANHLLESDAPRLRPGISVEFQKCAKLCFARRREYLPPTPLIGSALTTPVYLRYGLSFRVFVS